MARIRFEKFAIPLACLSYSFPAQSTETPLLEIGPQSLSAVNKENRENSVLTSDGNSYLGRLSVGYANTLEGPLLSDFGTGMTLDSESQEGQKPLNTKNEITIGYKIAEDLSIGPVLAWDFQPVQSYRFQIQDPYLRLTREKFASFGPVLLSADLRVSAPASEASRKNQLITAIGSEQALMYSPHRSNFILALKTYFQANLHHGSGDGNAFEFHVAPTVLYQIGRQTSATLTYELSGVKKRGSEPELGPYPITSALKPGFSWDVTPTLNLSPHLHIPASDNISLSNTTLGATLDWTLL